MHNKIVHKNKPIKNYFTAFHSYAFGGVILWTVFICLSLFWHTNAMQNRAVEAARIEARAAFDNHLMYRKWNAYHSGVYVPVTDEIKPNPYLDVQDRDIESTEGLKLTKVNPAYMTRLALEISEDISRHKGHITSLNPIRPQNRADNWEAEALKSFDSGMQESSIIQNIEGEDYLRLMRPLVVDQTCLKCHAAQGYTIGQTRGGISISVPMAQHYSLAETNKTYFSIMYGLIWMAGLLGTFFFLFVINRQIKQRQLAEEELRKRDKLEGVIEMARAVCHELNQPLQMIMGNTEILLLEDTDKETIQKRVALIKDQVERMGEMTRKLIKIADYETVDMPQGKVIDIEKSSSQSKKS